MFIEFRDYSSPTIADQWFGFQEEMEMLLGCKVDLTSARKATNPYFLKVANLHRMPLYVG